MKKLIGIAAIATFCFSAVANEVPPTFSEQFDEFADTVFAPVKISSYMEVDSEPPVGQSMLMAFKLGATLVLPGLRYSDAISNQMLHRQMINAKTIFDGLKPKLLNNTQIDEVLDSVGAKGITGSQRVVLVLTDRGMQTKAFKNMTKEELERSLQKLANNNVATYSIKVGKTDLKGRKVLGSAVAVYFSLEAIHTIVSGDI